MPRMPRYHIQGAFYHVMLRGNNGQQIFFSDLDRCRLCLLIQQGVERYGHRIHAFCFMSNHVHLLVQVGNISLSKIIHNLAFRYSQEVNRRYNKVGHLFQGRFKSIIVDEEAYFLRLIRYIHLNPVRANLVAVAENYKWSGHNAYLGQNRITWLTTENALAKFDNVLGQARKGYYNYMLTTESDEELNEFRMDFKDGQVLGSNDFFEDVREKFDDRPLQINSLSVIIDAACDLFGIETEWLSATSQSRKLSFARGVIALFANENGISIKEIALVFQRDESTISSLKNRFLKKLYVCKDLQEQVSKLNEKVLQLADLQA